MKNFFHDTIFSFRKDWFSISLIFLFSVFFFASFFTREVYTASVPTIITYQGKLLEDSLSVTTTKAIGFLLYDASSGGNLLYTASGTIVSTGTINITPSQGIFSIDLGGSNTNALTTSTIGNNKNLYLEVWVGDTKLSPRKQLTAAPYAINSELLLGISASSTSSSLYIPHSDNNGNFTFTGNPQSTGVNGGVLYVNPGSADPDETLFALAVAGSERFRVDEDGDVWINGALSVTNTLSVVGTSLFATTTVSGDLNVDSGTLYVDQINNRVGIASSSPAFPLSVVGQSYFSATSTVQNLKVLDGIVLGNSNKVYTWDNFLTADGNYTITGFNQFTIGFSAGTSTFNGGLTVDSGTLLVDATNNRVGINSSTPNYALTVVGDSYFSNTSTFVGRTDILGRVSNPILKGSITHGSGGAVLTTPNTVVVEGDYAYVTALSDNAFSIFNISDPSNPSFISSLANGTGDAKLSFPRGIDISGNYAYVASTGSDALEVINISDPKNPVHAGSLSNGVDGASLLQIYRVFVTGDYAYVPDYEGDALQIIDISNPQTPKALAKITDGTNGAELSGAFDVYVQGKYAYVTAYNGNALEILDVSNPRNPQHISKLVDGSGGALLSGAKGIIVRGKYAYITSGSSNALEIVDVSNPSAPVHHASLSNGVGGAMISDPDDLVVSGDSAYVLSTGSNALEIVDISNSSTPRHRSSFTSASLLQNPTSIFVSGNYAYIAGGVSNALVILDIGGGSVSNVEIGTAKISQLRVDTSASIGGGLTVKNGLSVGNDGARFAGDIGLYSNSTSTAVTNTLSFSHSAMFRSLSTSTNKSLFVFDTVNTFAHGASSTYLMSVRNNGLKAFSVASNGDVAVSGTLFANSAAIGTPGSPGDLAERVDIAPDDVVEPGDVVVVDSEKADTYRRSSRAYEQGVAGVISTHPSLVIGFGKTQHNAVMAMVGRVPIKVSTENGPIRQGDILVSASSTGYAMRYDATKDDDVNIVGIVGVALESLDEGKDKIMSLVRTGWVNNRHKTIADIQQELTELAEAQSVGNVQAGNDLNVFGNGGQIQFLSNDINANSYSILNLKSLVGSNRLWEVDEQGRFITRVTTSQGEKSLYSLQSGETEYVFSGSSHLQAGGARVDFDAQTKEIIDPEKPIKINITLTSEALGVFISGKDGTGFVVKELQGGASNATFDYVVIASRKIVSDEEDQAQEPEQPPVQNNEAPHQQDPPAPDPQQNLDPGAQEQDAPQPPGQEEPIQNLEPEGDVEPNPEPQQEPVTEPEPEAQANLEP